MRSSLALAPPIPVMVQAYLKCGWASSHYFVCGQLSGRVVCFFFILTLIEKTFLLLESRYAMDGSKSRDKTHGGDV
jgi:hypothetical protein